MPIRKSPMLIETISDLLSSATESVVAPPVAVYRLCVMMTPFSMAARILIIQAAILRNKFSMIVLPHHSLHSSDKSEQSILPSQACVRGMKLPDWLHWKLLEQESSSDLSPQSSTRLHTLSKAMQWLEGEGVVN